MGMTESSLFWFDGRLCKDGDVNPYALGLHYGKSVIEGIRVRVDKNGRVVIARVRAHVDRLFASARAIGMEIPFSHEDIVVAIVETVRKTVELHGWKGIYIRPIVFFGRDGMGLGNVSAPVHVAILTFHLDRYLGDNIQCCVADKRLGPPSTAFYGAKLGGQYVIRDAVRAWAKQDGFADAVMLDLKGNPIELTGANLVFLMGDPRQLYVMTPPDDGPLLSGLTRDLVVNHLIPELGVKVNFDYLHISQILTPHSAVKAVLALGTAAEITAVRMICNSHRQVWTATGEMDPFITRLRALYHREVWAKPGYNPNLGTLVFDM